MMFTEAARTIRHALKGKRRYSRSLVIVYLMTGLILGGTALQAEAAIPDPEGNGKIILQSQGGKIDNQDASPASAQGANSVAIGTGVTAEGESDVIIGSNSRIVRTEYKDSQGNPYVMLSGKAVAYLDENGAAYVQGADGSKVYVDKKGAPLADQDDPSQRYVVTDSNKLKSNPVRSVAIGDSVFVGNQQGTAVGNNSVAAEEQSLAIGSTVEARKYNATALGNNAVADGYGAIAIGGDDAGTKNQAYNAIKEGSTEYAHMVYDPRLKEVVSNPYVTANNSVSKKVYQNGQVVEEGTKAKYYRLQRWNSQTLSFEDIPEGDLSMPASYKWTPVKGNNITDSQGNASWDVMGVYEYYKDQGLTGDDLNKAVKDFYSPYQETESTGVGSIALGLKTQARADGSVAMGMDAVAEGEESMAFGTGTVTTGQRSVGMGSLASASGDRSIAIGTYDYELKEGETRYNGPHATADDAIAIGTAAYSDYPKGVALGADSITSGEAGFVRATYDSNTDTFTYGSTTTAGAAGKVDSATVNGVTYGDFAAAQGHGLVSIGAGERERRLQNVAAGEISATSTDAVNGSQLYSVLKNAQWTAEAGQEGTGIVENSSKTPVKSGDTVLYKAGDNLKLSQDGKNFTYSLQDRIRLTEVQTGQTVMNEKGLVIGGGDRQAVSLTEKGLDNGGNRIVNVAPGIAPTDGVNVSQLHDAVGKLSSDMNHLGAKAAALSSLRTIQYDPLEPSQISAGVGQYGGASAMALGVSYYANESTLFSTGIAFGGSGEGGKVMANASITWKFGHRTHEPAVKDMYRKGPISSTYALQDQVSALLYENAAQKKAMDAQQKEIHEQRNKIQELEAKLTQIMSRLDA